MSRCITCRPGKQYTIVLDGSVLTATTTASVSVIGPGYHLGVQGIHLRPGQKRGLTIGRGVSLTYHSPTDEPADLKLGLSTAGSGPAGAVHYAFSARGVDFECGRPMTLSADLAAGRLSLSGAGNRRAGAYTLRMDRIDRQGRQSFAHENVPLGAGDTVHARFATWTRQDSPLTLGSRPRQPGHERREHPTQRCRPLEAGQFQLTFCTHIRPSGCSAL